MDLYLRPSLRPLYRRCTAPCRAPCIACFGERGVLLGCCFILSCLSVRTALLFSLPGRFQQHAGEADTGSQTRNRLSCSSWPGTRLHIAIVRWVQASFGLSMESNVARSVYGVAVKAHAPSGSLCTSLDATCLLFFDSYFLIKKKK